MSAEGKALTGTGSAAHPEPEIVAVRQSMKSIRQKSDPALAPARVPDFRNLGVLLRLLLLVNLLAVATVLLRVDEPAAYPRALIAMAGKVELPLFLAMLLLFVLQPGFARWPPRSGRGGVLLVALAVAAMTFPLLRDGEASTLWRWLAWAGAAALAALVYFDNRSRRHSRSLTEARLMALTARIRPHFLFNCLNGVLGVIRSDPRRAEQALEELADLFRVLMRDNRELVPLGEELDLCERYVDLEYLRLGARLRLRWVLDDCPRDALVPPLLLQPLVENAIYHGVEPSGDAVEIVVSVVRRGGEICIEVDNPMEPVERHKAGNRMALENIRERLMLFFDLEAGLEIDARGGRHRVSIRLPYRRKSA
jgi:two-component system sensor histidine kinase AlgZ